LDLKPSQPLSSQQQADIDCHSLISVLKLRRGPRGLHTVYQHLQAYVLDPLTSREACKFPRSIGPPQKGVGRSFRKAVLRMPASLDSPSISYGQANACPTPPAALP
jgi:hypothetical protein